MEKTIWNIKKAKYPGELDSLLYDEWEPFAVTEKLSEEYVVWLRKIVRIEVKEKRFIKI